MGIYTARNLIQDKLQDLPELLRMPYVRLHAISFNIALALDEAKLLRATPLMLTRWQHFKRAIGWSPF